MAIINIIGFQAHATNIQPEVLWCMNEQKRIQAEHQNHNDSIQRMMQTMMAQMTTTPQPAIPPPIYFPPAPEPGSQHARNPATAPPAPVHFLAPGAALAPVRQHFLGPRIIPAPGPDGFLAPGAAPGPGSEHNLAPEAAPAPREGAIKKKASDNPKTEKVLLNKLTINVKKSVEAFVESGETPGIFIGNDRVKNKLLLVGEKESVNALAEDKEVMMALENILLKANEKVENVQYIDYHEELRLKDIDNLSQEDKRAASIFSQFDYKFITEKESLLKDTKHFNTGVFSEIHKKLGFGKGFGHAGKYGKEQYRPDYYR